MIYSFAVSTPANTAEADRQKTDVKLCQGVIHQIDIVFPTGLAGLLYVAINHGLYQVWPSNPGEYFHTDGETISFREHWELLYPPFYTSIYTYNLDDTYPHSVIIRLGILPRKFILRRLF